MKKFLLIFILMLLSGSIYAQQYKSHKVAKGENVYRIAKRYNVTTEAIYKINPNSIKGIKEGQVLAIPVIDDQEYKIHVVEKDDTVYSLAKKYKISKEYIYLLNPESVKGINIGQILNVGKLDKQATDTNPNPSIPNPNTDIGKELDVIKDKDLISLEAESAEEQVKVISYINHKVRRKETLFSIAKKYKITVEDIKKHNPRLYSNQIKKRDRLRIPVYDKYPAIQKPIINENDISTSVRLTKTTKYTIQARDTKYGIARRHGITVNELESLNPGMTDTFPIGDKIVVPTTVFVSLKDTVKPGFELYEVKPKETIFRILNRTGITSDSLFNMNPYLRNGLKAGMVITIPTDTLSFAVDSTMAKESTYVNLEKNLYNFSPKKVTIMLPFSLNKVDFSDTPGTEDYLKNKQSLRIALDLYGGMLIAIDSAKTRGITTELSVVDTQKNYNKEFLQKIIKEKEINKSDVVIGPLYNSNALVVASSLKESNVPVFSPASTKESDVNDNYFQTRPTATILQDKIIDYVANDPTDKNIVLIIQEGSKYSAVKEKLMARFPNAKIAKTEKGNYLYEVRLAKALDEKKPNWVFLESKDVAMISNVIPLLNAKSESYKITLFTTDKNKAFDNDNIKNEHLSKLQMHFPSVGKEVDTKEMKKKHKDTPFEKRYKRQYGIEPNYWAVRGFDIAYDVLMRLGTADSMYESTLTNSIKEYVENKFKYQKKEKGGYFNSAAYLVKFEKDLKLSLIK